MEMFLKYGDISSNNKETEAELFPSSYDMRRKGFVTSVKNQGSYGTCWAHSAIASAESSIIKSVPDIDLSEFQTSFYAYYGEDQIQRDYETEKILNIGGTGIVAANLWSQWIGPLNEKRIQYGDISFFDNRKAVDNIKYSSDYHLKNAYLFDYDSERSNLDEINSIIKEFVLEGNAVDVSFQSDTLKFYDSEHYSTRSNRKPRFASHSVVIVGWDDNFPKENFKIPAETDGAWLVKNSWGENSFDRGYMWISYDDSSLCEFAVFQLEDSEDHTVNFHHDTFVSSQSMSAGESESENKPSYMANIFKTDEDVQIEAVSVNIIQPDTDYEIMVYKNLNDLSDPASGTMLGYTKGTEKMTGIVTIELAEDVIVNSGDYFSVVMKAYSEASPYVIPIEAAMYLSSENNDKMASLGTYTTYEGIKSNTRKGESFYSEDGIEWLDAGLEDYIYNDEEKEQILEQLEFELFDGLLDEETELIEQATETFEFYKKAFSENNLSSLIGNISLKAIGNPVNSVDFSHITGVIPGGEKITISVKNNNGIWYSVDDGEYRKYTEPIEINGYHYITATTDNVHFTERSYITEDVTIEKGDIDLNGTVDSSDASIVLRHYSNMSTGKNEIIKKAIIDYSDMNNDGKTDSSDASEILKIYAQKSTS